MNKRIEDIIAETRLNEILHKNEAEKQKNTVIWTLAIIGAVAAVAAIAYAVYRFVSPIILMILKMILMTILMITSARMIRYNS